MSDMFSAQSRVMEELRGMGRIPEYPITLSDPQQQAFLKLILVALGEEVQELDSAFKEFVEIHEKAPNERPNEESLARMASDINEELCDCLAFTLEVLILLGVKKSELEFMIRALIRENNLDSLINGDLLDTIFNIATYQNAKIYLCPVVPAHYELPDNDIKPFLPAAVSTMLPEGYETLIADIYLAIFKLSHKLKANHWRQTKDEIKVPDLEADLVKLTLKIFQMVALFCYDSAVISEFFLKKANINLKRFRDGR